MQVCVPYLMSVYLILCLCTLSYVCVPYLMSVYLILCLCTLSYVCVPYLMSVYRDVNLVRDPKKNHVYVVVETSRYNSCPKCCEEGLNKQPL